MRGISILIRRRALAVIHISLGKSIRGTGMIIKKMGRGS